MNPISRQTVERAFPAAGLLFAAVFHVACWLGWAGGSGTIVAWGVLFALGAVLLAGTAALVAGLASRCAARPASRAVRILRGVSLIIPFGASAWILASRHAPCENLMGNHDQGMYLAAGGHLARTGQFRIALPDLDIVAPADRSALVARRGVEFMRGSDPRVEKPLSYAVGFPLSDPELATGDAIPHFPLGSATLLAAAFATGGFELVRLSGLAWIGGGLVFFALFALKRYGALASAATALLLAASPILTWLADRQYAEAPLFLLSGLICATLAWAPRKSAWIAAAVGLQITAAPLLKFDGLVAAPALVAACALGSAPRPFLSRLLLWSGVGLGSAISLLALQSGPYMVANLAALAREPAFVAAALLAPALLVLLVLLRKRSDPRTLARVRTAGIVTACALLTGLYVLRSHPTDPDFYYNPAILKSIRSFREDTLARLDWYWVPFGFLPALAALAASTWRRRAPGDLHLAYVGLATLVLLAWDIRCDPSQPFCMRRLAPYSLPALFIGVAALPGRCRTPRARLLAGLPVVAFLAGGIHAQSRIGSQPEFPGTWTFLEQLATRIPDNAVVLVSERSPLAPLVVPLRTIFGRQTWQIDLDKEQLQEAAQLRRAIVAWNRAGHRVLFMGNDRAEALHLAGGATECATLEWSTVFQLGAYESPVGPLRSVAWNVHLYELTRPR